MEVVIAVEKVDECLRSCRRSWSPVEFRVFEGRGFFFVMKGFGCLMQSLVNQLKRND